MVPGFSCESPLRKNAITRSNSKVNSLRASLDYGEAADGTISGEVTNMRRVGGHYNEGAPPGHWRPQHKRTLSQMEIRTLQPDALVFDHDASGKLAQQNGTLDLG